MLDLALAISTMTAVRLMERLLQVPMTTIAQDHLAIGTQSRYWDPVRDG